jgi:Nucleotide-binding protein implicated in inhibition of septum formation
MEKNILYLGSQSPSRQKLLKLAQIPFEVIQHTSDECGIAFTASFDEYVLAIAKHKMEHLKLPKTSKPIFVLTADTLVRVNGNMLGKPHDITDAKHMLSLLRNNTAELVTGCCLEQKECGKTLKKKHWTTPAQIEFSVPEEHVEDYFKQLPQALHACGAGIVEGFGLNYLKQLNGSFTSVLGLPLFELHEALKELKFN